MVYDAAYWRERRNWSALTGALTGAATRKDYLAMLRHIEAARAAGMPDERIRYVYAEVVKMVPSVPPLDRLEQTASGAGPAVGAPPTVSPGPTISPGPTVGPAPTVSSAPAPSPAPSTSPPSVAEPPAETDRPAVEPATAAVDSPATASAATTTDASTTVAELADPTGRPVVQQLDYWLTMLRTGDDTQKIEARGNLSRIFEERGMLAEAIEMLEGNAWAGVRDADAQRRLAALYRQIGRQDLADKAISDLYQLGMTGSAASGASITTPSTSTRPGYDWPPARSAMTEGREAPASEAAREPAEPPPPAPPWRRPRPAWLIVALMIGTFGLYAYYWLFATWRELKRESEERTMHPFWHMLGIAIIPVYGWLLFYAHLRTIRRLAITAGTGTTLSPGFCLWLFIITAMVNRLTVRIEPWTPTPPWLDLMVLAIDVVLVAWPQAVLTAAWQRLPGVAAPFRVHGFEWLILILGGLAWAGVLLGLAPP